MNKKQLAIKLSCLKNLDSLKVNLEQYQTEGNLGADLLWLAYQNGDIKNKVIADLGCGNGIFGIGALLLGARFVYFLDCDKNAISTCKENLDNLKLKNYKLINLDISEFKFKVDTVVMNPPFGVRNRKADKSFLEFAMKYSDKLYSIHKIESKKFIEILTKERGFIVVDVVENSFFIKKSYEFHKEKRHEVLVGIWVIERNV